MRKEKQKVPPEGGTQKLGESEEFGANYSAAGSVRDALLNDF